MQKYKKENTYFTTYKLFFDISKSLTIRKFPSVSVHFKTSKVLIHHVFMFLNTRVL